MLFKGEKIGPNVELLVLSRPQGDIELKFQAILDFDELDKLVKEPEVPQRRVPGGKVEANPNDLEYIAAMSKFHNDRLNYIVLKSLEMNPDLQWEKVKLNDPNTWDLWKQEMREAGLTPQEISSVQLAALRANTVDGEKVEQARKRFLAGKADESKT